MSKNKTDELIHSIRAAKSIKELVAALNNGATMPIEFGGSMVTLEDTICDLEDEEEDEEDEDEEG